MKKIILSVTILLLAGCSNSEHAESMLNPKKEIVYERVDIGQELNASYCEMGGFKRFHESEKYYTFECKDESKYRIPK
jgi:uncharacterized protein YcfL